VNDPVMGNKIDGAPLAAPGERRLCLDSLIAGD
jgi:hypothetical protein